MPSHQSPSTEPAVKPQTLINRPCPQFVMLGALLLAGVTIASIVTSFLTLDVIIADWTNIKSVSQSSAHYIFLKKATYIGGVIIVAMKLFFCWLITRRQNWARIVMLALSMLSLLTLPSKLEMIFRQSFTLGLWYTFMFVITIAGLICLFMPVSNLWFKSAKN